MRAVVQRARSASVTVEGALVAEFGGPGDPEAPSPGGLVVFVGVTHSDGTAEARQMARKLWHLRILDGERSAADLGAPVLVISQFTLYADTAKGRRPSWSAAAPREVAEPIVAAVCDELAALGAEVRTGVFGANMQVSLVNDGPVTLLLEV